MTELKEGTTVLEEDTQHGRFLTFMLGEEAFGIGIDCVTEIIGIQPVSGMPGMPGFIKGIINLRGRIIPLIDMRIRFHKEEISYSDRTCIIVIDLIDTSIGLIVDNVSEVLSIRDEDIDPPPRFNTGIHNRYIRGIGKVGSDIVLLLDCEKLLTDDELSDLVSSVGNPA